MKIKINKKTVGVFFLSAILLLTFFSKTIYTYNLPEVTAVKPVQGQLSKVEVGYGTVQWAELDSVYIPEEGMVLEIYVREGEVVTAGQKLFAMEYDKDDNERALQEVENSRNKLRIELQNLSMEAESLKYPDAELLKMQQELTEAEKYLSAANSLYDIGGISSQELSEAGNNVNYLRLKVENSKWELADRTETIQMELETKRLELEQLAIKEEPLKMTQEIHNNGTILMAPRDGMVMSFHVMKGKKVSKDTLAAEVGTGNEYLLHCPVPSQNNFIAPGDSCNLSNSSHQLKGVVTSVVPSDSEKTVVIRFTAEDVAAGETFDVLFQKQSATSYNLVPNGAINKDSEGYYLKQIKRRNGIMGKEYYLERLNIYIGDSDSQNTAVIQGITFFEPVMLSSEKTASVGDVVLLKNAGDFFEE